MKIYADTCCQKDILIFNLVCKLLYKKVYPFSNLCFLVNLFIFVNTNRVLMELILKCEVRGW